MSDVFSKMGKMLSESMSLHSRATGSSGYPVIIEMSNLQDAIRRCRTDGDMTHFMDSFVKHLSQELGHPKVTDADTAFMLQQCMICHSLGYHISFAHTFAIQLSQTASSFYEKLTAYTACQVFLHEESEMSIMMIATIQRDIRSREPELIRLALTCSSHILNPETIPAMLPLVLDRAAHPNALVRRSVISCLTQFIRKSPDLVTEVLPTIEKAFRDREPMVMLMALQAFSHTSILRSLPAPDSLIKPLVSIVQQIGNGKLPTGLSRNQVPAHHILISALQLLPQLVNLAEVDSEMKLTISLMALAVLDSLDSSLSITAWAVKTECCLCLASLGSSEAFHSAMEHHISKLLTQNDESLKAVGFKLLEAAAEVDQKCLLPHRKAIIAQLSGQNRTLSTKALGLLLTMADEDNIEAIIGLYNSQIDSSKVILLQQGNLDKFVISGLLMITRVPKSAEWLFEKLDGLFVKFGKITINVLNEAVNMLIGLDDAILADLGNVMQDRLESLSLDMLLIFISLPQVESSNPQSILEKFQTYLNDPSNQRSPDINAKIDWFLLCYQCLKNSVHLKVNLTIPASLTINPYTRLLLANSQSETTDFQASSLDDILSMIDRYCERVCGKVTSEVDTVTRPDEIQLAHRTDVKPATTVDSVPLQLKTTNRIWSKRGRAQKPESSDEKGPEHSEPCSADPTEALAAQVFHKLEK